MMSAFLHILLCSAAAIGSYYAVGLTSAASISETDRLHATRYIESGLMAVPIVREGGMRGFLFLKAGSIVNDLSELDDTTFSALVADATYDTLMPKLSQTNGGGLPDLQTLDLDTLRSAIATQLGGMNRASNGQDVHITQLDMRSDIHLRRPTLRALIEP